MKFDNLRNIKAPEYLKTKTLEKARQTKTTVYKKRLLTAVCAFAIVFGGIYGYQRNSNVANEVKNSFGLVAYAANTGEIIEPHENILVFNEGTTFDSTIGYFTGCLFKIQGENIEKVKITINSDGGIYRSKMFTEDDFSADEIETMDKAQYKAMWNGEDIGIAAAQVCKNEKTKDSDLIFPLYDEMNSKWYVETIWKLDNKIEEIYDSQSVYGFWLDLPPIDFEDTKSYAEILYERLKPLEDVTMYVTVTFENGQTKAQTYTLHTGKLAVEFDEKQNQNTDFSMPLDDFDVSRKLTGKLAKDGEPYIYGVYARLEQ